TYIIDENNTVHMAHIDIHFTHSTNGVASLHTQILKKTELNNFYNIYPYKFNNKTNGITFRRWLMECNPLLTAEIENLIGSNFKKDANELTRLLYFERDTNVLKSFYNIKKKNKENLINWLYRKQGIYVNPNAIFCIQSKRLHEYKRQQLNLLYLIHLYQRIITDNYRPPVPVCCIFGGKAAPAYTIAKDIIHALITLREVVEKNPIVSKWLQIVFVENYNVTAAEKMIPACDLSEQISLASKEASGTGNMKFMLNGALTLGTLDGANVEIAQKVGNENIYIFGESSDMVINKYKNDIYHPRDYYDNDLNIRKAIDFLVGPEMMQEGSKENLERLYNEILNKDYFQTLPDFNAYTIRKTQAIFDYANDPINWSRRCLVNVANSGYFSSDRTIAEYNAEIWHL
nr:glycogen/starch/alpha-glucan phosphorylase [Eubacterium sp.]